MEDTNTFSDLRPSLFSAAYRILGSATEAEDVVQEAYPRWAGRPERWAGRPKRSADDDVDSVPAYFTTVVTQLCIDQLRSARVRRERYKGPWLPELEVDLPDPAEHAALADSLSPAFLVLLEELGPVERAAFLLHDVFNYPYDEIGRIVERSEPACRQLVRPSPRRVAERRHRFDADQAHGRELTRQFAAACVSGDLDGLVEFLAEDFVVWTDGGGKVRAAMRPVTGLYRASRFLLSVALRILDGVESREAILNGQPGMLLPLDRVVTIALALDIVDDRVSAVRIGTNPDKLGALHPEGPARPDHRPSASFGPTRRLCPPTRRSVRLPIGERKVRNGVRPARGSRLVPGPLRQARGPLLLGRVADQARSGRRPGVLRSPAAAPAAARPARALCPALGPEGFR